MNRHNIGHANIFFAGVLFVLIFLGTMPFLNTIGFAVNLYAAYKILGESK